MRSRHFHLGAEPALRTKRFSSRCGFVIEVRGVVLANASMSKALH